MKALNFLLILIAVVVQAQNPPIVPLGSRYWEVPSNSYFKDINNELNKYVEHSISVIQLSSSPSLFKRNR